MNDPNDSHNLLLADRILFSFLISSVFFFYVILNSFTYINSFFYYTNLLPITKVIYFCFVIFSFLIFMVAIFYITLVYHIYLQITQSIYSAVE